jgi:hypothetical protein
MADDPTAARVGPRVDYSEPFRIEGCVGNNAFAYARRGPAPTLRVPSLLHGTFADVAQGREVAFEEVDDDGRLRSCTGLAHLVRTTWADVPTVVVDNHNHAFYFWYEAVLEGRLGRGATLVHLDQHRDTRGPDKGFAPDSSLVDAFRYTNFHLNVGNYIVPARQAGVVGDVLFVTGSHGLDDRAHVGRHNLILNIDLDFFAPEMSYIDFDRVRRFIDAHRRGAALITIATSPFFVEHNRAVDALTRLVAV